MKNLKIDELTHHTSWATHNNSAAQHKAIAEYVFNHNRIGFEYIQTIQALSIIRLEYRLTDLCDYARIKKLDLQMKAAMDDNRVTTTIEGGTVAIEYPLSDPTPLYLGDVLPDKQYTDCADINSLVFPVGRTTTGKDVFGRIEDLKHILIAGTSGSGKSIFLNTLLLSLIANCRNVSINIIDPKIVEYRRFKLVENCQVITEIYEAVAFLKNLCAIMDERYQALATAGARDIESYNAKGYNMHRIVLVVDELGDLMKQAKRTAESYLVRLAQKARACGIHLILATQYPTADIVTGAIKQNMPTKICFAVPSTTASVVMLGRKGAEKLLGKGDMLYQTEQDIEPKRLQAPFVTDADRNVVIAYAIGIA